MWGLRTEEMIVELKQSEFAVNENWSAKTKLSIC